MKALITGIAGFAGSHLAEYLLAHTDLEVCGVIHRRDDNIAHLRDRLMLFRGDLRDYDFVSSVLARTRPDLIFHLAAQAFVPASWRDPWDTLESNIRSQLNVLRAAVELGLEAKVLVVGSNEEYGLVRPEDLPLRETAPLRPDNPYGVSKVAQDMLGLQYRLSHGLHTVRVRPFNHIGPRQSERFVASAFAKQIAEVEANLRPPVIRVGNLSAKRDFTDVRDVVRAYWLILNRGEPGEVYNIGSGVPRSIRELLDILLGLSKVEISVKQDPSRLRPSDVPISYCDFTKLRERTGWQPTIPFEESLRDVLNYWRQKIGK
ncbi:MAG TPA: SDR family oxidoreductase [Anaerolineae bacterium]|nr:SDR family oxidoreductase [Anaerolineae bacterium]